MSEAQAVCPGCNAEFSASAATGDTCPSCGTSLVQVHGDDEDDLIGTVIDDRFEIVARLGQGGMATVYRAKQRSIGRDVALKLIDRKFEQDVATVKRFMREAKLASQLSHPNTVGVIEFGQDPDGRLYLAMELVRGRTLYDVAKDGAMPLARVARIGAQLCDALEAAHALSIVHRDLKLENIMLLDAPAGRDLIKVLDFGLARSFVEPDTRATATGVFAGTPKYMAPEVIEGAQPAPAQDLYALGVILGELASGASLWDAPTMESLFAAKVSGNPKLDGIDPALRGLVEQLLVRIPGERPPHAEIRTRLLALEASQPVSLKESLAALALEPTQLGSHGPPSISLEPPKRARQSSTAPPPAPTRPLVPSGAAFVPPAIVSDHFELEDDWKREKATKQREARQAAPPRRKLGIASIIAALVIVGVVVAIVAVIASRPRRAPPPPPVVIEIHAKTSVQIRDQRQHRGRDAANGSPAVELDARHDRSGDAGPEREAKESCPITIS